MPTGTNGRETVQVITQQASTFTTDVFIPGSLPGAEGIEDFALSVDVHVEIMPAATARPVGFMLKTYSDDPNVMAKQLERLFPRRTVTRIMAKYGSRHAVEINARQMPAALRVLSSALRAHRENRKVANALGSTVNRQQKAATARLLLADRSGVISAAKLPRPELKTSSLTTV